MKFFTTFMCLIKKITIKPNNKMNKHLLLGSALLVAISAYPQAGKQAKPTGIINEQARKYTDLEKEVVNTTVSNTALAKHPAKINDNAKTAAVTVTRFTGSMNVFGLLVAESNPLQYSAGPNIVAFTHRKSPTYTPAANGNSGSQVTMLSTNVNSVTTTWDSTCIWTNATDLARYPQGAIYNPLGNTTYTNAYVLGMGPITNGTNWIGNWYCSKRITMPGTNASGVDQQSMNNAALPVGVKVHHFSRYSSSAIDGGYVRSMGTVLNDPAGATNVAYGPRGAMMTKGLFTAGTFTWTTDSFIPPVTLRTDGSKHINANSPLCVWNEAGTTGYVVMNGSRLGAPTAQKGYQPLVYKTTNSGASWSLLPSQDFTTPNFVGLTDRLYPVNTNSNIIIPQFSQSEGYDAAVDVNGNLHIVTTVVGSSSQNNDSLDYAFQFAIGGENYGFDYSPLYGKPAIYDFYTMSGGGWDYYIVDTMASEGPSGTTGQPGFAANPWANPAAVGLDARIQISRTTDGKKLYYSWTTSDPAIAGNNWNIYPNIRVKGYDVVINKVTPTYSVTDGSLCPGFTGVDGLAYWHYMSDKAIGNSSVCVDMPFTACNNATNNGNIAVDHYFIKGQQICPAAFTLNPWKPTGVAAISNNNPSTEVNAYPNPASQAATISVGLKDAKDFELSLYNSIGQQVIATIKINGKPGSNDVFVDLSKLNSGIYFYSVKTDNSVVTKKLIIE